MKTLGRGTLATMSRPSRMTGGHVRGYDDAGKLTQVANQQGVGRERLNTYLEEEHRAAENLQPRGAPSYGSLTVLTMGEETCMHH